MFSCQMGSRVVDNIIQNLTLVVMKKYERMAAKNRGNNGTSNGCKKLVTMVHQISPVRLRLSCATRYVERRRVIAVKAELACGLRLLLSVWT
jgi:hypothetical protein